MTYPTIRPELTLDFANSRQLDPRITFSRSSGATYLNPDTGLITSAYTDQARFEKEGLLIEESRTNLIPNSQVFATGYSGAQFTITDNAVVAPDGTTTAASLLETAVNDAHYVQLSSSSQTNLSQSIFVKPNGRDNICVRFVTTGSDWYTITFNLTGNGSITQEIAGTGSNWTINSKSITPLSNGWYRISAGATTSAATIYMFSVLGCDSSTPTLVFQYGFPRYTGDVTKGYYVWGAQVEANSLPSSYIPTAGLPGGFNRATDIAQITGNNFSNWFNEFEGTLTLNATDVKEAKYASALTSSTAGTPDTLALYRKDDDEWRMYHTAQVTFNATGSDANFAAGYSVSGSTRTASAAWKGSLISNVPTDASSIPFTSLQIGTGPKTSGISNGHVTRLSYYTRRLTDSELQTITS
jgi:hypothetical protein